MTFRTRDPLAVAVGNASLFGIGYFLLGRRRLGAATVAVSLVLVAYAVAVARTWAEIVVLVWWAAPITHGWFQAGRDAQRPEPLPKPEPAPRKASWFIAAGSAAVVLVVFGVLRFDAVRAGGDVADARAAGDCAGVLRAQDGVWLGDRVADAPLSASGDAVVRDCHRLQATATALDNALASGDSSDLQRPFRTFASVLSRPGNERIVAPVLDGFLNGLPTEDPCGTAALTDWLRDRKPATPPLNRSADTVRRTAPAALLSCADDQMDDENWTAAKTRYQQLADTYPDDDRAEKAKDGAELANVSGLLDGPAGDKPAYCSHPAKYGGAPKYGKGTNKAMFFGNTEYTGKLPKSWRTGDPEDAALIVCADDDERGSTVQGCPYTGRQDGKTYFVNFHKINIKVRAYELRTAKKVADRTIEISGTACPPTIHWTEYHGFGGTSPGLGGLGPDPDQYVRSPDVDGAFHSLVIR